MAAFRLVHDIQAEVPDALVRVAGLRLRAESLGWGEVVRACLLAQAVAAWLRREPTAHLVVSELVELSANEGDEVMLACGLGLRSVDGLADPETTTAADRDAGLARAVVLLERTEGQPIERITAHTACEIGLLNRSLFELAAEQAHAALAIRPECPPEAVDFLLGPVVFNLAETEVCWAAMLRQLGDREGVAERWQSWRAAEHATAEFELATSWRRELAALGLLLTAMVGLDVAQPARRMLEHVAVDLDAELRTVGVLRLCVALSDADAGLEGAGREIEAAVAALDPNAQPHLYDLALHVAALVEQRVYGRSAGLRSTRRQLEQRWATRLSSLAGLESLIRSERQADQIELLSRHARLDDLTGIGNRRALSEHLVGLERLGVEQIALVLLDVDNFKVVNDRHGHLVGDAVLTGVASVLQQSVRATDLAVRLGGDEFAVVLGDVDLEMGAERALDLLRLIDLQPFDDVSPGLRATLSAGVAVGSPAAMRDLWSRADAALYRAKAGVGTQVIRSRLALPGGEHAADERRPPRHAPPVAPEEHERTADLLAPLEV